MVCCECEDILFEYPLEELIPNHRVGQERHLDLLELLKAPLVLVDVFFEGLPIPSRFDVRRREHLLQCTKTNLWRLNHKLIVRGAFLTHLQLSFNAPTK